MCLAVIENMDIAGLICLSINADLKQSSQLRSSFGLIACSEAHNERGLGLQLLNAKNVQSASVAAAKPCQREGCLQFASHCVCVKLFGC